MFLRNFQAREVARFQQRFMLVGEPYIDNRTDGVDNVFARQIKRRRDFCLTRRLLVTLFSHKFVAGVAQR